MYDVGILQIVVNISYFFIQLRMNFRWNTNIDTSLQFSKNVRMY